MTAEERVQAAAQIITDHRASSFLLEPTGYCRCGKLWTPLHVANMLDKAGLLCALVSS